MSSLPAKSSKSSKPIKTAKYRPVLTEQQITHILELTKKDLSPISMSIISVLSPFQAKIANKAIIPAYTTGDASRPSLLESLGGTSSEELTASHANKEDYWKACYDKYVANPASCSLQEIEGYKMYSYINSLMTEKEEQEFELSMMSNITNGGITNG